MDSVEAIPAPTGASWQSENDRLAHEEEKDAHARIEAVLSREEAELRSVRLVQCLTPVKYAEVLSLAEIAALLQYQLAP